MIRDYLLPSSRIYEFNNEDHSDHTWGEFVLNNQKTFHFNCDGNTCTVPSKGAWTFIHRDEFGVIDHLFSLGIHEGDPNKHKELCPLCNPSLAETYGYDDAISHAMKYHDELEFTAFSEDEDIPF